MENDSVAPFSMDAKALGKVDRLNKKQPSEPLPRFFMYFQAG
jgi:hypothetical protein